MQVILHAWKDEPFLLSGLILIGISAVLVFHIQLKMLRVGESSYKFFGFPRRFDFKSYVKYLRIRGRYGWSPWPVYVLCLCLILGVVLLVIGFRAN